MTTGPVKEPMSSSSSSDGNKIPFETEWENHVVTHQHSTQRDAKLSQGVHSQSASTGSLDDHDYSIFKSKNFPDFLSRLWSALKGIFSFSSKAAPSKKMDAPKNKVDAQTQLMTLKEPFKTLKEARVHFEMIAPDESYDFEENELPKALTEPKNNPEELLKRIDKRLTSLADVEYLATQSLVLQKKTVLEQAKKTLLLAQMEPFSSEALLQPLKNVKKGDPKDVLLLLGKMARYVADEKNPQGLKEDVKSSQSTCMEEIKKEESEAKKKLEEVPLQRMNEAMQKRTVSSFQDGLTKLNEDIQAASEEKKKADEPAVSKKQDIQKINDNNRKILESVNSKKKQQEESLEKQETLRKEIILFETQKQTQGLNKVQIEALNELINDTQKDMEKLQKESLKISDEITESNRSLEQNKIEIDRLNKELSVLEGKANQVQDTLDQLTETRQEIENMDLSAILVDKRPFQRWLYLAIVKEFSQDPAQFQEATFWGNQLQNPTVKNRLINKFIPELKAMGWNVSRDFLMKELQNQQVISVQSQ